MNCTKIFHTLIRAAGTVAAGLLASTLTSSCSRDASGQSQSTDIVYPAYVIETKGLALYREYGKYTYTRIKKGHNFKKFSTLYTGPDGWVTLSYVGKKSAAVSVPPNSIFRVESDLPITNLLRKGFTRSKFDMLQNQIISDVVQKDSNVVVSGVQDISELDQNESESSSSEQQVKAVRFGIRMALEMKKIPVSFPVSNLFLTQENNEKKTIAPIEFRDSRDEDMQAFVWQVRPLQKIVWNGRISKKAKRIKIALAEPGTYVFQSFGISGRSRTRSIRIVVNPSSDKNVLFPSGILAGDTIIIR